MDFVQLNKNDDNTSRTPINRVPSLSFSVGDITDVTQPEAPTIYSVTAVLNYCKNRILKPYLRLLSVMGLRPLSSIADDGLTWSECCSYIYTAYVIIFIFVGYVLQYMACFRRDRGFGYKPASYQSDGDCKYDKICHGSMIFSYIIPNGLHLIAYLYALTIFRSSDDDQLPSLMERVFLALSNLSDSFMSQKRLMRVLWMFVGISVVWMLLSFISVNLMMAEGTIEFRWMESKSYTVVIVLKCFLVLTTLWHDMIQATVISNYCLQAQLLTSYLQFLRAKLLQYTTEPIDWMRDMQEFQKLLKFFNCYLAPSVCIFTINNLACTISGTLWLFNFDHLDKDSVQKISIAILNVVLWALLAVAPFVQAARLSSACEIMQRVGHEVRVRPFVHQSTPGYKLDSILLYSSSLKLSARLFGIPVKKKYLYLFLFLGSLCLLVMGQLHYLNAY